MSRLFAFVDLETTGLDPDSDSIIEIAWAFTDEAFNVVGTPTTFLVMPERGWFSLGSADQAVRDMHSKSGLMDDLMRSDAVDLDGVAEQMRAQLATLPGHTALHLAGFSVHFDRAFLAANGFRSLLGDWFHHRHLDLSAVKLLLDAVGVPYEKPVNERPHRALADVFESIEQARLFAVQLSGVPVA